MADRLCIQLADAVVADLNGTEFSLSFTAARRYRPIEDLKKFKDLVVTVIPADEEHEELTRAEDDKTFTIHVGVQKKVDVSDESALDAAMKPLLQLVEELIDHFRAKRYTSPAAICFKRANRPVWLPRHLEELHQLTSVVVLSFRIVA